MLESYLTIPYPVRPITEHCPVIQVIAFTFLTKSTHFLKDTNGATLAWLTHRPKKVREAVGRKIRLPKSEKQRGFPVLFKSKINWKKKSVAH